MTHKIHKTIKVKEYTKEDYEKDQQNKVRRTARIGVDFQKIEETPMTELEREVQAKIAVEPEARDLLLRKEEKALLSKALEGAHLSSSEKTCIKLTMERLKPNEIAQELGIDRSSVRTHLSRATAKIRSFIHENFDLGG